MQKADSNCSASKIYSKFFQLHINTNKVSEEIVISCFYFSEWYHNLEVTHKYTTRNKTLPDF